MDNRTENIAYVGVSIFANKNAKVFKNLEQALEQLEQSTNSYTIFKVDKKAYRSMLKAGRDCLLANAEDWAFNRLQMAGLVYGTL